MKLVTVGIDDNTDGVNDCPKILDDTDTDDGPISMRGRSVTDSGALAQSMPGPGEVLCAVPRQAFLRVQITRRAAHPGLTNLGADCWLFDAETGHAAVVWCLYSPGGQILGRDYSDDAGDVRPARGQRDLALAPSLPLTEFMALLAARARTRAMAGRDTPAGHDVGGWAAGRPGAGVRSRGRRA